MPRTIAQIEAGLAYWQNVRWQVKTEELRQAAHEKVEYFRRELNVARVREARTQECCGGGCEEGRVEE